MIPAIRVPLLLSAVLAFVSSMAAASERPGNSGGFSPTRMPSLEGSSVSFVIVTTPTMMPEFERLAAWRTKSGLPSVVRTLDEVLGAYPTGVDAAERLRLFLRDAHDLWGARWVLLGGDSDVMPVRQALSTYFGGASLLTDLYFACLDGNWNADGDGIFGEAGQPGFPLSGDAVDFRSEVFVGRAPVSTLQEARVFVDKTLAYEKTPPANWADRALLLGEVLFPADWGIGDPPPQLDGATLAERVRGFMPGTFQFTRLFQNYPAFAGSLPETRVSTIAQLNAGPALVHHVGHGFRFNMSVGDVSIVNADADALTNGARTFVLYALNCTSAAFNFNCISERFMKNPNGGAVAVVGSTDLDFPTTSIGYQDEFYENIYTNGMNRIGEAFTRANEAFANYAEWGEGPYRWTQYCLVLLGDPTLPVWPTAPRTLSVSFPATVALGTGGVTVTVQSAGQPVAGALVTLAKGTEAYASATTNAAGQAVVPFWPRTVGAFTVAVTGFGAKPFEGQGTVGPAASAHLVVSSVRISLEMSDGKIAAGDLPTGRPLLLDVRVRNEGSTGATGLSILARSSDPWVSFTDSTAGLPNLPASSEAWSITPLQLSIDGGVPDGRRVAIEVRLNGSGGLTSGEVLEFRAVAPRIALAQTTAPVAGPPPWQQFSVSLANRGAGGLGPFVATVSPLSGVAAVQDSTAGLDTLAAGAQAIVGPFVFQPSGTPRFLLRIENAGGALAESLLVDFAGPATPEDVTAFGGADFIHISWTAPAADDLAGYRVYRSSSAGGPFTPLSLLPFQGSSFYEDLALPPTTTYYYRVAAVDESGNESAPSGIISTSTSPPSEPGWPTFVGIETPSAPALVDVTGDSIPEVIAGSEKMYAYQADGNELLDGDGDPLSHGIFAPHAYKYWASPAVADLDGDGMKEIVCCSWQDDPNQSPNVSRLYVWHADGTLADGWPQAFVDTPGMPWATPALGDLDGDGNLEIVVSSRGRLYAFHHDGLEVRDGDANPATTGVFAKFEGSDYMYGSPAIADIDKNGPSEIIFCDRWHSGGSQVHVFRPDGSELPGFPRTLGSTQTTSSPAVADIDGDETFEIVLGSGDDKVYAIRSDGLDATGWPRSGVYLSGATDFQSSPAIGDIDGDGDADVVIGSNDGKIHAWRGRDGAPRAGFPMQITAASFRLGSPIIGEIDGERPGREIVIPGFDAKLYAVNHNGTTVPGFPYTMSGEVNAAAVLGDADGDGIQNLLFQSKDQRIYLLEFPGVTYSALENPWPMFRQNVRRNGSFVPAPTVGVALACFRADVENGGVRLSWQGGAEGILLWSVRRGVAEGSFEDASRLNDQAIVTREREETSYFDPGVAPDENVRYWLEAITPTGAVNRYGPLAIGPCPERAEFLAPGPNPFSPRVSFRLVVPAGASLRSSLRIFDVRGRLVRAIFDGVLPQGAHDLEWNGVDERGVQTASGVYFARARIGEFTSSRRIVRSR